MLKFLKIVLIVLLAWGAGAPVEAATSPKVSALIVSARQGNTNAMCDLALAYFHGNGVLKDPFKAKCWTKKAYGLGNQKAEQIWNSLKLWQYSGKCDGDFEDAPVQANREGDVWQDPVTGMRFAWIPGGCFEMGCHKHAGDCKEDEHPLHPVCLDGFWMGIYEVTQGQWQLLKGTNPSRFKSGREYPVESVSLDQIREFLEALNARSPHRFSLPTEAQWEYACRGEGRPAPYAWGREAFRPKANCGTCDSGRFRGRTAPVGSFSPNRLGLYDLGGNVREWCRDVYQETAYSSRRKNNPVVYGEGSERVVRGGAYSDNAQFTGCTRRHAIAASMKSPLVGVRLVVKKRP